MNSTASGTTLYRLTNNRLEAFIYPQVLTGDIVRKWLELAAGVLCRINPSIAAPQDLTDRKVPVYGFDVMSGLTWKIDLSQPARYDDAGKLLHPDAHRMTGLQLDAKPIDPTHEFVVVTNIYRDDGGGAFPGLKPEEAVLRAPDTNRDVLRQYIASQPSLLIASENS